MPPAQGQGLQSRDDQPQFAGSLPSDRNLISPKNSEKVWVVLYRIKNILLLIRHHQPAKVR